MATIAKLGIKLEADGEAFASSVDVAAKKAKGLEDQAKKTAEAAKKMGEDAAKAAKKAVEEMKKAEDQRAKENSIGGRIESLNKAFGADSALGKIAGALAGGAFVGGIAAFANAASAAADKVIDLNKQLREGKISTGEYAKEVTGSIPVLGDLGKTLAKVLDAGAGSMKRFFDANARTSMEAAADIKENVANMQKVAEIFKAGKETTESLRASMLSARLTGADRERDEAFKQANDANKRAYAAYVASLESGGGAEAEAQYDEQHALIGQKLKEDLERIEQAPILEKAKQNAQTIAGIMDSAAKSAEQAGMSEIEKVLDELKRAGATSSQIDLVGKNLRMKEATEEARKAIEEAKKLADETQKATESKAAAAAEKVKSIIADLRKDMERFSMSDAAKAAAEVRDSGGSAADQNTAAKLRAELDLLTKKRDIIASLETPQEKYNKQLETLNDLLNQGMLTQDEYAKAALNNLEEFKRSQKSMEQGSVGIAMADSAEGIRAIRDRGAQGLGTPQNKELVDLQKKQLAEQQKQNAMSERILKGEGIIQFTVATL